VEKGVDAFAFRVQKTAVSMGVGWGSVSVSGGFQRGSCRVGAWSGPGRSFFLEVLHVCRSNVGSTGTFGCDTGYAITWMIADERGSIFPLTV